MTNDQIPKEETEMKDLQRTIYLAVKDPDFRARLQDDPKAALNLRGLRPSADEIAAICQLRRFISVQPKELTALLLPRWPIW